MKDLDLIKTLVGENITEAELKDVDCYVQKKLGLFIPSSGRCGYASRINHSHPSYMVVIFFPQNSSKQNNYPACVLPPGIPHNDELTMHYYCVMIDKDYFESQFALYSDSLLVAAPFEFEMCSDILKTLNTFAFEYSKSMMNSDITLEAQVTVITHWIIRSIHGETLDLRSISSDYSIARAQHYIEQHYGDKLTVSTLSELGYMSASSLNRRFRSEVGASPMEYLTKVRITQAKVLLRRKDIPITEIALRCGFSTSAYFSSCFIKNIGMTPSDYQSKYIE